MEADAGRQHVADAGRQLGGRVCRGRGEAARRAWGRPRRGEAARRGRQAAGADEVTRCGRGDGSVADGQIRLGKA